MDAGRLSAFKARLPFLVGGLALLAIGLLIGLSVNAAARQPAPDPAAIANRALLSVREQGRMVSLVGRYVAVVTTSDTRIGLTARKTLIMPGTVRYGVDLSRLRRQNLAWDEPTRTLTVTLPPLEISGPQVDLSQVQEYSEGGLVMALTDAERTLDQANRRRALEELMRQARDRIPTSQARNAAMRIVARGFAMPLRSAGIDASVTVRFVDPAGREEASFLDRPNRIEDAVRNTQS